jgi:hypothetical protein
MLDPQNSKRFAGHEGGIRSCKISPDGLRMITKSNAGVTRLWDIAAEMEIKHLDPGRYLFSPDSKLIIFGGGDGRLEIVDARTGERINRLGNNEYEPRWLQFSPQKEIFVTASGPNVAIWELLGDSMQWPLRGTKVFTCYFSRAGNRLVTIHDKRSIWDADTGELLVINLDPPDVYPYLYNYTYTGDWTDRWKLRDEEKPLNTVIVECITNLPAAWYPDYFEMGFFAEHPSGRKWAGGSGWSTDENLLFIELVEEFDQDHIDSHPTLNGNSLLIPETD